MQLRPSRKGPGLRNTGQPRASPVTRIPFTGTIAEPLSRLVNTAPATGRQVVAAEAGRLCSRKTHAGVERVYRAAPRLASKTIDRLRKST